MPKLYYSARRASEPASSEPWQIPGRQDNKAERVDVPAVPAALAAWLNARRVPLAGDAFDGLVPLNPAADELLAGMREEAAPPAIDAAALQSRCPACKSRLVLSAAGADKLAISLDLDAISDWAFEAPTWAIARLAEIIAAEAVAIGEHAGKGRAN